MTRKITTRKARQIREAIKYGNFLATYCISTLWAMEWMSKIELNRFQRKVAVDVYHRNR